MDTGSEWTASTGAGEPPKKGIIARFWWVGCLLVLLLVLALIAVGGIVLLNRGGDDEAGGEQSTSQEETTTEEEVTDEETTEEQTSEEEATEEETTEEEPEADMPTDVSTIDPEAEKDALSIVGMDGSGTIALTMEWVPASELESSYSGTVEEPENGDEYLVVTAKQVVTEGEMSFNPAQFDVLTPYGGEVGPAVATYGLKGSGTGGPLDYSEGQEHTYKILFDVRRAGDLTLNYTTYTDDYTWDIPA